MLRAHRFLEQLLDAAIGKWCPDSPQAGHALLTDVLQRTLHDHCAAAQSAFHMQDQSEPDPFLCPSIRDSIEVVQALSGTAIH